MEYIPTGDKKYYRYDIVEANAAEAILPCNLYADDLAHFNRNFTAIRLFKEQIKDKDDGKGQHDHKKVKATKDRNDDISKNEDNTKDGAETSSLVSKSSKTIMTGATPNLFERSRATRHMKCIGEKLDIEVQAAEAELKVQRKVEESQRSKFYKISTTNLSSN